MGLKNQLTTKERAQIRLLRQLNPNTSGLKIGQEIGRWAATINQFLANPKNCRQKTRPGRPEKLGQCPRQRIRYFATGRKLTAGKILANLQLDCNIIKVYRTLANEKLLE